MEYQKIGLLDKKIEDFVSICNEFWPRSFWTIFKKDQQTIDDTEIYLIIKEEKVIGGAVLNTQKLVSTYLDKEKLQRRNQLSKTGYKGCSYFVISSSHRGQGFGSLLINHIQSQNSKIWLRALKQNIENFYLKNGFKLEMNTSENDPQRLLTFSK